MRQRGLRDKPAGHQPAAREAVGSKGLLALHPEAEAAGGVRWGPAAVTAGEVVMSDWICGRCRTVGNHKATGQCMACGSTEVMPLATPGGQALAAQSQASAPKRKRATWGIWLIIGGGLLAAAIGYLYEEGYLGPRPGGPPAGIGQLAVQETGGAPYFWFTVVDASNKEIAAEGTAYLHMVGKPFGMGAQTMCEDSVAIHANRFQRATVGRGAFEHERYLWSGPLNDVQCLIGVGEHATLEVDLEFKPTSGGVFHAHDSAFL